MATVNNQRISRRGMMQAMGACGAAALGASLTGAAYETAPPRPSGRRSALGLKHPPLQQVRVGMIGVGGRGMSLLGQLLSIDGVAVTTVCDIVPQRVAAAQARVAAKGQPSPVGFSKNETDFENLCQRDDVDLVYVATPWEWHTAMAVCAMNGGKHVAIEVPAAITLQECWDLVDTSERTQRHCMMLENCCYGETEMLVMNMVRQGVLGELTHGEAGYIHPYAAGLMGAGDSSVWRRRHLMKLNGKKHQWETDLGPYFEKYGHPLWKQHKEQALKTGGHGGMDYVMNWRLIHCLRKGGPLDMTVYDAAAWSSVFPLSVASVAKGSTPVSVPDFTRGQWKRPRPLLAAAEA